MAALIGLLFAFGAGAGDYRRDVPGEVIVPSEVPEDQGGELDHTCPEHCPAQVAEAVADELRKLYPEACPDADVDMFMEQLFRETLGLTRQKMPCSGPVMVHGSWKCPLDDISSSAVPRAFAPTSSHARDLFAKVRGADAADPGQFL